MPSSQIEAALASGAATGLHQSCPKQMSTEVLLRYQNNNKNNNKLKKQNYVTHSTCSEVESRKYTAVVGVVSTGGASDNGGAKAGQRGRLTTEDFLTQFPAHMALPRAVSQWPRTRPQTIFQATPGSLGCLLNALGARSSGQSLCFSFPNECHSVVFNF